MIKIAYTLLVIGFLSMIAAGYLIVHSMITDAAWSFIAGWGLLIFAIALYPMTNYFWKRGGGL